MQKNTSRPNGFSLIELLIAMGVTGAIALALATLLSNTFMSVGHVRNVSNLNSLQNDLQLALAIPELCKRTFKDVVFDHGSALQSVPQGQEISATLPGFNGPIRSGATFPQHGIKVGGLRLSNTSQLPSNGSPNLVYLARLTLYADSDNPNAQIKNFAPRPIGLMYVNLDPGSRQIVSCNGGANMQAPEATCTSIGGTWDASRGKCKTIAKMAIPIQKSMKQIDCPPGSKPHFFRYDFKNSNNSFFMMCEQLD